jgi:hypothetical protein
LLFSPEEIVSIYSPAFWINWALAIFFGSMLLIMLVVDVIYWTLLGEPTVTVDEFHGLLVFTALLAGFVAALALTTWAAWKKKIWWPLTEVAAIAAAASAVGYIGSFG